MVQSETYAHKFLLSENMRSHHIYDLCAFDFHSFGGRDLFIVGLWIDLFTMIVRRS